MSFTIPAKTSTAMWVAIDECYLGQVSLRSAVRSNHSNPSHGPSHLTVGDILLQLCHASLLLACNTHDATRPGSSCNRLQVSTRSTTAALGPGRIRACQTFDHCHKAVALDSNGSQFLDQNGCHFPIPCLQRFLQMAPKSGATRWPRFRVRVLKGSGPEVEAHSAPFPRSCEAQVPPCPWPPLVSRLLGLHMIPANCFILGETFAATAFDASFSTLRPCRLPNICSWMRFVQQAGD
jgi:hypothetical protein